MPDTLNFLALPFTAAIALAGCADPASYQEAFVSGCEYDFAAHPLDEDAHNAGGGFAEAPIEDRVLALTFTGGGGADTATVVAALDGIPATFFLGASIGGSNQDHFRGLRASPNYLVAPYRFYAPAGFDPAMPMLGADADLERINSHVETGEAALASRGILRPESLLFLRHSEPETPDHSCGPLMQTHVNLDRNVVGWHISNALVDRVDANNNVVTESLPVWSFERYASSNLSSHYLGPRCEGMTSDQCDQLYVDGMLAAIENSGGGIVAMDHWRPIVLRTLPTLLAKLKASDFTFVHLADDSFPHYQAQIDQRVARFGGPMPHDASDPVCEGAHIDFASQQECVNKVGTTAPTYCCPALPQPAPRAQLETDAAGQVFVSITLTHPHPEDLDVQLIHRDGRGEFDNAWFSAALDPEKAGSFDGQLFYQVSPSTEDPSDKIIHISGYLGEVALTTETTAGTDENPVDTTTVLPDQWNLQVKDVSYLLEAQAKLTSFEIEIVAAPRIQQP